MAFTASLTFLENKVAQIRLAGELDASSAPSFKSTVEEAAAVAPSRLILEMSQLDFMASAGLRVLIFAKQKMGPNVEVHVVGAKENVRQTIAMTGFDRSVVMINEPSA